VREREREREKEKGKMRRWTPNGKRTRHNNKMAAKEHRQTGGE